MLNVATISLSGALPTRAASISGRFGCVQIVQTAFGIVPLFADVCKTAASRERIGDAPASQRAGLERRTPEEWRRAEEASKLVHRLGGSSRKIWILELLPKYFGDISQPSL